MRRCAFFKQIIAAVTGYAVNRLLASSSRRAGIPTPSGQSTGRETRAHFEAGYPGTTPWEWLGSSGGPIAGPAIQAHSAQKVARINAMSAQSINFNTMKTQERIAEIQAQAQRYAAAVSTGDPAFASEFMGAGQNTLRERETSVSERRQLVDARRAGSQIQVDRANMALMGARRRESQAHTSLMGDQAGLARAQTDESGTRADLNRQMVNESVDRASLLRSQQQWYQAQVPKVRAEINKIRREIAVLKQDEKIKLQEALMAGIRTGQYPRELESIVNRNLAGSMTSLVRSAYAGDSASRKAAGTLAVAALFGAWNLRAAQRFTAGYGRATGGRMGPADIFPRGPMTNNPAAPGWNQVQAWWRANYDRIQAQRYYYPKN